MHVLFGVRVLGGVVQLILPWVVLGVFVRGLWLDDCDRVWKSRTCFVSVVVGRVASNRGTVLRIFSSLCDGRMRRARGLLAEEIPRE